MVEACARKVYALVRRDNNLSLGDGFGFMGAWWRDLFSFFQRWTSDAFLARVRERHGAGEVSIDQLCELLETREGQSLVYARGVAALKELLKERRGGRARAAAVPP